MVQCELESIYIVQMSTSLEGTQPIKCGPMKTLHNDTCKYLVCHPSPKQGVARTEQRCTVRQHPPLLFRFSLPRTLCFDAHDTCCIDVTLVASYHHLSLPPPSARLLPPRMEEIPKCLRDLRRGGRPPPTLAGGGATPIDTTLRKVRDTPTRTPAHPHTPHSRLCRPPAHARPLSYPACPSTCTCASLSASPAHPRLRLPHAPRLHR